MDKTIVEFLDNKKADFLKKKIKADDSEEKKMTFQQQANDKFCIAGWLLDSSNRAEQLSLTTHPPKFSHPDAKIAAIIANCNQTNDGLLRYGNVQVDLDVVGNAASLDVDKFLRLELNNKLTILQNLEQNTDYIKTQFNIDNFDKIRHNFLKIKKSGAVTKSSDKLKQVYFPVANDYHLLSLLTPSAIIYKLKQRINENFQPFSEKNKQVKEKVNKSIKSKDELSCDLEGVWGLTAIGYGGTKPQNISVLNNKNGGVAYLLSSMPPILKKRKVQPPKENFFKTNIYLGDWLKQDFKYLKEILSGKNNIKARNKRDEIIVHIMFQIKTEVDKIRALGQGWSDSNTYNKLPKWQKILLDDFYLEMRNDQDKNQNFLNETRLEFSKWFCKIYNKQFDINLGDIEITHIEGVVETEMEVFK